MTKQFNFSISFKALLDKKNKAFNNLQTARSLTSKRIRAEKFPRNRPEIPMQESKLPESMIISPTVYKLLNTFDLVGF